MYGLRQLPLNVFLHLKKGLEQRGFEQLKLDPCLFFNDKVIFLIYVDDCLFFVRKMDNIARIIKDLKAPKKKRHKRFLLDEEDNVA